MTRTILYARVSTMEQNIDIQREQAEAAGFDINEVVADHGVSGVSTKLADREGGKRLFDMLRAGDVLVVRWIDRLGRNYEDVTSTIRLLMARGVVVRTVINGMIFDGSTTDPMQVAVRDALIGFMAAMAEAQAMATKEAQKTGIRSAKVEGRKYRGRKPSYDQAALDRIAVMVAQGVGTSEIARECSLTRQAVIRIKADPQKAQEALDKWSQG